MELRINHKLKKFDCMVLTIQGLLDFEFPNRQNGIAVAVNQIVIPKNQWRTYTLAPTDEILIITATQGG